MKVYQLRTKQQLPISLQEAWDFFSDPGKLPELTPPWMQFQVESEPDGKMYPGMIATYQVRPILGIRLSWVTEITHTQEQVYFVDEQRFGPYRFWHHEHHFTATDNGVEMADIVHYALPLGILGQLMHKINIEKKLQNIFQFRYHTLKERFGAVGKRSI
ncbi:hypothetical protein GCM10007063_04010 [Lentibacillus kapialis]|uniref:Coenzyme Q-binding protein COQ10 START domain-containing protein n=1 Tax=Lentibacillus kapialis TaxID=340214 RepID=A0A917UTV0_9BACI|nr:SRPBCC family protein [Lentibacillus kapialis]GGJ84701.1 hypothetical protein GCM10007063_04010 [Lentibacillus kapialis]